MAGTTCCWTRSSRSRRCWMQSSIYCFSMSISPSLIGAYLYLLLALSTTTFGASFFLLLTTFVSCSIFLCRPLIYSWKSAAPLSYYLGRSCIPYIFCSIALVSFRTFKLASSMSHSRCSVADFQLVNSLLICERSWLSFLKAVPISFICCWWYLRTVCNVYVCSILDSLTCF